MSLALLTITKTAQTSAVCILLLFLFSYSLFFCIRSLLHFFIIIFCSHTPLQSPLHPTTFILFFLFPYAHSFSYQQDFFFQMLLQALSSNILSRLHILFLIVFTSFACVQHHTIGNLLFFPPLPFLHNTCSVHWSLLCCKISLWSVFFPPSHFKIFSEDKARFLFSFFTDTLVHHSLLLCNRTGCVCIMGCIF